MSEPKTPLSLELSTDIVASLLPRATRFRVSQDVDIMTGRRWSAVHFFCARRKISAVFPAESGARRIETSLREALFSRLRPTLAVTPNTEALLSGRPVAEVFEYARAWFSG